MQKKFMKEGVDVQLKKSGSVNPVIMVKQFSNILNDIKDVHESQEKLLYSVSYKKAVKNLRVKHDSVSHK